MAVKCAVCIWEVLLYASRKYIRNLSDPGSDALAVDTLITDKVNNMQYLSNARTFQKCFHEELFK